MAVLCVLDKCLHADLRPVVGQFSERAGEKLQSTQGRKEEKRGCEGCKKAEEGPQWRSGLEGDEQRASKGDTGINSSSLASQAGSPVLKTGGLHEDFHSHTGRE